MLISEEYRAQLSQKHAESSEFGAGAAGKYADIIGHVADDISARTILDYGAGKQSLAKAMRDRTVISYDPAVPEIAGEPDPADLVVCTDVMEHIEPKYLDDVLADIQRCTLKAALFTICVVPAHKHLPDGRNAHLIVEDVRWWCRKLFHHFKPVMIQAQKNGFLFVGTPV